MMKLYRYRTIESALAEIEHGTFYFASREELNDPIEGYIKLYFQGDQPAWEGLLRNYVYSLFICIHNYLLISPSIDYTDKSLEKIFKEIQPHTVIIDLHRFDSVPIGKILRELSEVFLNDDSVQKLVNLYGDREFKCLSKELKLILRTVHHIAFNLCIRYLKAGNILQDFPEMISPGEFPFEAIQSMDRSEWIQFANEAENMIADAMEHLNFYAKSRKESFDLTDSVSYNHRRHMTWANIQVNFPKIYVGQLQNIIYPDAHVVCFSETDTNSAMWGNYAQNHQGICFVYETQMINDQNFITVDSKKMKVRRITYDGAVIERNFFTTFGRLTYTQIQTWLTGKNGKISKLIDRFSDQNVDSWRNQYWSDYIEKFHRKNSAWDHEKEYRIMLEDTLYKYDSKTKRCLTYDSLALKGIIFGINTSIDDKFRLVKKIQQCGTKFTHVKFYQAEYEDDTQKISPRPKFTLHDLEIF